MSKQGILDKVMSKAISRKLFYIFNGNWADALVGFIIRHMGHDCDVLYWHAGSG